MQFNHFDTVEISWHIKAKYVHCNGWSEWLKKQPIVYTLLAEFLEGIFLAISGMGPKSFLLLIHERLWIRYEISPIPKQFEICRQGEVQKLHWLKILTNSSFDSIKLEYGSSFVITVHWEDFKQNHKTIDQELRRIKMQASGVQNMSQMKSGLKGIESIC